MGQYQMGCSNPAGSAMLPLTKERSWSDTFNVVLAFDAGCWL